MWAYYFDRARKNALILVDETRGIISATETGIIVKWAAEELDRLKALIAEQKRLLEMYKQCD